MINLFEEGKEIPVPLVNFNSSASQDRHFLNKVLLVSDGISVFFLPYSLISSFLKEWSWSFQQLTCQKHSGGNYRKLAVTWKNEANLQGISWLIQWLSNIFLFQLDLPPGSKGPV